MKRAITALALWVWVSCVALWGQGTSTIQFEQTVVDFGKISGAESVSGTFKFKNVGTAVLKLEQPATSCGCTVATLKTNSLNPGETGELPFTLNLGMSKAVFQKEISVASNDPKTPQVVLTVRADYTPLYEITPLVLWANVTRGDTTNLPLSIRRTDGKALKIHRVEASKPWIQAKLDSQRVVTESWSRLLIELKGDGPLGALSETLSLYADDKTNSPIATVSLGGQITGEVTFHPQMIYWRIADRAKAKAEPAEQLVRRTLVRQANGKEFTLKNVRSSLKPVKVEVAPREGGRAYEIAAQLTEIPESTATGTVSFETSVITQPTVEIPVTISVVWLPPRTPSAPNASPPIVPAR